jgi:peptidase E
MARSNAKEAITWSLQHQGHVALSINLFSRSRQKHLPHVVILGCGKTRNFIKVIHEVKKNKTVKRQIDFGLVIIPW